MNQFKIGMEAYFSKKFEGEDVIRFSEISGDKNPVHLDMDFAKRTIFGERIVHGFLYSSLISSVLANQLPGPGSIYLHQELNFLKPVFWGDTVTAIVRITELRADKNIVILDTICTKNEGVVVVTGKAVIKVLI